MFAKTKSISRESNLKKIFLGTLNIMLLTILTLLYQTLWEIPLVHKVRTCYTCMAANDGDII